MGALPEDDEIDAAPAPMSAAALAIEALRYGDCRWPIGDPAGAFRFCCGRALVGRPYCAEHTETAKGDRYAAVPAPLALGLGKALVLE